MERIDSAPVAAAATPVAQHEKLAILGGGFGDTVKLPRHTGGSEGDDQLHMASNELRRQVGGSEGGHHLDICTAVAHDAGSLGIAASVHLEYVQPLAA